MPGLVFTNILYPIKLQAGKYAFKKKNNFFSLFEWIWVYFKKKYIFWDKRSQNPSLSKLLPTKLIFNQP